MKSSAQVVVVGGGVVGASVLYHLTKAGWTDVVLLERKQLTAGSTWHAAGGMHTLNGDPNVARLQQYTVNLYKEIEAESGQQCGIHLPGGLMLADTPERLDWLRMAQARGRYLGMHMEIISVAEAKELNPLLEEKYFVGAAFDPDEGSVDPYGVTHAYAICARNRGAEVYTDTWVTGLEQRQDGTWDVITDRDHTIHAEHVVNCGGLWAREVGRMVGLELPVLAMEHHYLLTEPMPEVIAHNQETGRELPHMIDFAGEIYAASGGSGHPAGNVRAGQPSVVAQRDAMGLRLPTAPPRPRSHRPGARTRFRALPGRRARRHPEVRQRPVHVQPRRQSVGRSHQRHAWYVGRLRGDGGSVARWWGRLVAGQLDRQRRPAGRHLGNGRRSIRRLGDARLHQRQGARELLAPVPHHVSERRTAGCAAAAHHADLRPAHGTQRGVGRRVRPRAPAVVPGARRRADRERHVPPLERVPTGCRGIAGSSRARRTVGGIELRQVQGQRRRRRRLAAGAVHQHAARRSAAPT